MSFELSAGIAIAVLLGVLILQRFRPTTLRLAASPEVESVAVWAGVRYLLTIFLLFGVLLGISHVTGWNDAVVLTGGGGLAIIAATLTRFDLFWDHPKALWLRGLVGDRWAAFAYIGFGLGCLTWAGYRAIGLTQGREQCQFLLDQATDSHERIAVLQYQVRPDLPTCERLVVKH